MKTVSNDPLIKYLTNLESQFLIGVGEYFPSALIVDVRSERLEYSLELKISMSFAFVIIGINKSNMECGILGFNIFYFAVRNLKL